LDFPVVGDWTGGGKAKIGIYREGFWYFDLNGDGIWSGCGPNQPDGCWGPFGGTASDYRLLEIGMGVGLRQSGSIEKVIGSWI